jgi:hypothetical protein
MRRVMILSVVCASVFILLAIVDTAVAWNIQPVPSITDKKIGKFDPWFKKLKKGATAEIAEHYTKPQHEDIAHRIFGCDAEDCRFPQPGQKSAPPALLAGVRWNDTPPFTLLKTRTALCPADKVITIINDPECWGILFKDAKKQAETGRKYGNAPSTLVLYRSHFGDMQFLHSMASSEQEFAGETKRKIMAWAEFMYKIALGKDNTSGAITRGTSIKKTGISDIDSLFTYRYDTIQTLFVSDAPREYKDDENLHLFAMGVLIHMVSDSFSNSHVERGEQLGHNCRNVSGKHNPGWVRSFHVYTLQDSAAHSDAESDYALAYQINYFETSVVDVGQTIMEYYSRKAPWEELKGYLDCVYDLADPNAPAGPGSNYKKIDKRAIDANIIPSS